MMNRIRQMSRKQLILVFILGVFLLFILGLFIGYAMSSDHFFIQVLNPMKWKHVFDFIFV